MFDQEQVAPDEEFDWAARYQGALRALPLAAGALGIIGVLINRFVSGVSKAIHTLSSRESATETVLRALSTINKV